MRKPRLPLPARPLGSLCLAAALLGGCHGDQPGQIDTIQRFAKALRSKKPRVACGGLVKRMQDEINCDSVLVPLLHYSPGFPGSNVTQRGHASGWRLSQVVTVPIHYEGLSGSGNAEVTLEKSLGEWRISLFTPSP